MSDKTLLWITDRLPVLLRDPGHNSHDYCSETVRIYLDGESTTARLFASEDGRIWWSDYGPYEDAIALSKVIWWQPNE